MRNILAQKYAVGDHKNWFRNVMGNWYTFKGDNSIKIAFAPFWKGVYSKKKEFAPKEANSFLLE